MRSITRLNREGKRLQRLVQSLLDTSRIERGQLTTELEADNLTDLIRDTLERSEAYATHTIDAEIENGLVGELDSARIQQVLENLLENARKYSPRGSTVHVRAWAEGNELRFSVSDDGVGIPPEDHPKVFERYYRTEATENGAAPGIGLGLYICKQIVELHEGRIWVDSAPGIGTTFNVALPRATVGQAAHDKVNTGR
jgi:signal transduction histidine kinase